MIAIFPEIAACAAKGDIERLAVMVRDYFGGKGTFAPCLDVAQLAEIMGLKVKQVAMEGKGVLLAKDERGAFTITLVVSQSLEGLAQRFLLAHLIGHYFFDVQPMIARAEWDASGYRELVCPLRRYAVNAGTPERTDLDGQKEYRADQFAGALLLPSGMVKRSMETLKSTEKVAAFFGVSGPMLERRLIDLGLKERGPASFLEAEAAIAREDGARNSDRPTDARGPTGPKGGGVAEARDATEGTDDLIALSHSQSMDGPTMPRSFAASTYGQTARVTGRAQGMERIREIAMMLEKRSSGSKDS